MNRKLFSRAVFCLFAIFCSGAFGDSIPVEYVESCVSKVSAYSSNSNPAAACAGVKSAYERDAVVACVAKVSAYRSNKNPAAACAGIKSEFEVDTVVACVDKVSLYSTNQNPAEACAGVK